MQIPDRKVKILPYDSTCEKKFEIAKYKIVNLLGKVDVVHRGSTSLKISGQDEIDVYIPVSKDDFIKYLKPLVNSFGNPRNTDHSQRIRFTTDIEEKKIDLFLIDKECEDWKNGIAFEKYLKEHPDILKEYESFKENLDSVTIEEYYEKKNIFTEMILKKISQ